MQDWQDADDAFNRTLAPYDHATLGDFDQELIDEVESVDWGRAVIPE